MNMTEKDWERCMSDWRKSFSQFTSVAKEQDKSDSVDKRYIHEVGRGTPKARFFCTEVRGAQEIGFWAPKSAIVSVEESVVKLQPWFKVKTITYSR